MWRCTVCGAASHRVTPMLALNYGQGYCYVCSKRQTFQRAQPGMALGRAGMAAAALSAGQGVDAAWIASATAEARRLAAYGRDFTINDVTDRVGLPIHRNAVGHLLPSLARQGLLVKVGFTQGTRESQHGRAIAVWRGAQAAAA